MSRAQIRQEIPLRLFSASVLHQSYSGDQGLIQKGEFENSTRALTVGKKVQVPGPKLCKMMQLIICQE